MKHINWAACLSRKYGELIHEIYMKLGSKFDVHGKMTYLDDKELLKTLRVAHETKLSRRQNKNLKEEIVTYLINNLTLPGV